MYQRVTLSDFINAFYRMGREQQFSRQALTALFEHLEQYEEDTGNQVKLDVVALCCDYEENDVDTIVAGYDLDAPRFQDDDARRDMVERFLNDHTTIVWKDRDTFLYKQF